ncbi:hypothetical protein ML462_02370 [Gramella lutea]|uniref:Uncharacterized protein n=1 Tax=Christiangramia lutea TaxID=1607951 RepID=A0A9X1V183_9FLAO|nr:hypothetical protein [Christiangramia lutea]MCH4822005.1 hypothetical protein [Christiangramia lutea]
MGLLNRLAAFSLLFIYACSQEEISDSPDSQPGPQEQVLVGKFLDSEVEGLIYSTPTREGITNSEGEFEYLEGEIVSFKVGGITLGSAAGDEVITPIDIATASYPTLETQEVKNISALLQTLDADKDPSNGITISQEAIDFLPESQIDFSSNIIEVLGNLVLEINKNTLADLKVVMPEEATVHLAQTLDEEYSFQGLESITFFNVLE